MADEFVLPSGETVPLRGLTGFEVMLARKKYQGDDLAQSAYFLACAMDTTEDAALGWMKSHLAGDMHAAEVELLARSGLGEDADKS